MFVLSILLIAGIAAGITWPLLQRRRLQSAAGVAEPVTVAAGTAAVPRSEQLCPYCSKMNPPSRTVCDDCGNALPVNNLAAIFEGVDREAALRELKQGAVLFGAMIVAMCLSNWMTTPWKIAILMVTFGLLAYRLHRSLIDD